MSWLFILEIVFSITVVLGNKNNLFYTYDYICVKQEAGDIYFSCCK